MLPKQSRERWNAFYESARHNPHLDDRTTLMLHLAVSMSTGCYP